MKKFILLLFVLQSGFAHAQQTLSLEACIERAKEENIRLKQARQEAAMARVNLKQSRLNYLPTVNATADANRIFGTAFDNNTFQRVTATTTTSYPIINAQLLLFDGFRKYFSIKQNKFLSDAGQEIVARVENEVEANVISYFLQSIFDQENIKIAEKRVELFEAQLIKIKKLEAGGIRREGDVYLVRSQLAAEKLDLLTYRQNYNRNLLYLLQELNLPVTDTYTLTPPASNTMAHTRTSPDTFLTTLNQNSPYLREARLRVVASRQALHTTISNFTPSLGLTGSIGSSYSSNGIFDPETRSIVQTPYFEQLDQNLFQVISLRLTIPIFNGLSAHHVNQLARLQLRNDELNYTAASLRLQQTIQQAYQDVEIARQKLSTVQTEMEAVQKSFEYAKRNYELGTTDFYTYLETLNNKNKIELQLLQSGYETALKYKILLLYTSLN